MSGLKFMVLVVSGRAEAAVDCLQVDRRTVDHRRIRSNPDRVALDSTQGTSGSAPVVSGAAALLKQEMRANFGYNFGGKELIPQFLVMSDSFD
jgi:hypothetical protein